MIFKVKGSVIADYANPFFIKSYNLLLDGTINQCIINRWKFKNN